LDASKRSLDALVFSLASFNTYLKQAVPYKDAKPDAVITVHTFGDFQEYHPHLHILTSGGCFYNDGLPYQKSWIHL